MRFSYSLDSTTSKVAYSMMGTRFTKSELLAKLREEGAINGKVGRFGEKLVFLHLRFLGVRSQELGEKSGLYSLVEETDGRYSWIAKRGSMFC